LRGPFFIMKLKVKHKKKFFTLFLLLITSLVILLHSLFDSKKLYKTNKSQPGTTTICTQREVLRLNTPNKAKLKAAPKAAGINENIIKDTVYSALKPDFSVYDSLHAASFDVLVLKPVNSTVDSVLLTNTDITENVEKEKWYSFYNLRDAADLTVTGVNDFWALVKRPFTLDNKDLYSLAAATGGVLLLAFIDGTVHKEVKENLPEYRTNGILQFGAKYGTPGNTYTVAASLASAGLIFRQRELVQTGIEAYESYFIAANITSALKRTFGRARPNVDKGVNFFQPFSSNPNTSNAFPSGHATVAFSLSTVLASHIENPYLKAAVFAPAVITSVSRVMQNYHWTSDVFMGAAIGYFVGSFISNNHSKILPENMFFTFDKEGNLCMLVRF